MEFPTKDITIIGAGPAGLFALFYAGMRGASAQIVDALPEAGGQLAALYPEKYIFDVGGLPKILAKDLANSLHVELEYVETSFKTVVLDLQSGKCNVFFGFNATPERALATHSGCSRYQASVRLSPSLSPT